MLKFFDLDKWLELTATLILVYLVLSNSRSFSTVIGSLGTVYTDSVKTLQGR